MPFDGRRTWSPNDIDRTARRIRAEFPQADAVLARTNPFWLTVEGMLREVDPARSAYRTRLVGPARSEAERADIEAQARIFDRAMEILGDPRRSVAIDAHGNELRVVDGRGAGAAGTGRLTVEERYGMIDRLLQHASAERAEGRLDAAAAALLRASNLAVDTLADTQDLFAQLRDIHDAILDESRGLRAEADAARARIEARGSA